MSKLFDEMAQGTAEVRAYMEGERKGYRVTLPESIDVRGIRNRLHVCQGRFADAFGLSVDAGAIGSRALGKSGSTRRPQTGQERAYKRRQSEKILCGMI